LEFRRVLFRSKLKLKILLSDIMINCDNDETGWNQDGIPVPQCFDYRCVLWMSGTYGLEGRLESVRKVKPQQYERDNIENHSNRICETIVQLAPISKIICLITFDILKIDLMPPEIIHVQAQKCQYYQTRNNHITRSPGRVSRTVIYGIFCRSGLTVSDFKDKTHNEMKDYCKTQHRLHNKLY